MFRPTGIWRPTTTVPSSAPSTRSSSSASIFGLIAARPCGRLGTSESLAEEALASLTMLLVQGTLNRIEHDAYGKCIACGRQIEKVRLEAIPWALYCLDAQERQDKATHVQIGCIDALTDLGREHRSIRRNGATT